MNTDLVVFDMAGTTIRDDDAVNRCLRETLLDDGVVVTRDDVNRVMGLPKPTAIASLVSLRKLGGRPAPATEVGRLHATFLQRMIDHYRRDPGVAPMPGALECFAALRSAGVRVALDTGFSREIVDAILRRIGWEPPAVLDATVASDEVRRGRPYPDLVFEAMQRTGVTDVRRVAKVGDTPSDLQEGMAAGCGWVIGVTNGTHTHAQLAACAHTHLIANLAELGPVLGLEDRPTAPR